MRRMKFRPVLVFLLLFAFIVVLTIAVTWQLPGRLTLGDFRGVVLTIFGVFAFYIFAVLVFRLFQKLLPLPAGELAEGSHDEFIYHVYLLFYLLIFNPVMFSGLLPIPLMRIFYQGLGARMGANTFSVGILFDPQFIEIGRDSIIGNGALLIPHIVEGSRLAHYPIRVGNGVTVGARAVVLADVEIGDGAIVAIGAVVKKGSRIPAGETWGGVPARRIDLA